MYTFKGGTHVEEHKDTKNCAVDEISAPGKVYISLSQCIGAPCVPVVEAGDDVTVGQKIGDIAPDKLGCPVHASVSGKVAGIEEIINSQGARESCVVIENDFKNTPCKDLKPFGKSITDADSQEIISLIRESGITGMGGAAFPTYAKISSALGHVDQIIVNCAECEPHITSDHRLLLETPEKVINGVKILMLALGVKRAYIAVEDNKRDAADILKEKLPKNGMISVKIMKTKYPQGDERQLIYALTKRELPVGKLPMDAGCVIFNAGTCAAVYTAFDTGMPLVNRIVTVSGDCVKNPGNYSVPVGMRVSDIVESCGSLIKQPAKIIFGGPMMGRAEWNINMPVKKGTSAVLLLSEKSCPKPAASPVCIRCGKCVANCPMRLMPVYIAQYVQKGDMKRAEEYGAMSCVECGTCSYNCPGKVEIVQYIRTAKNYIRTEAKRIASLKNDAASDKN